MPRTSGSRAWLSCRFLPRSTGFGPVSSPFSKFACSPSRSHSGTSPVHRGSRVRRGPVDGTSPIPGPSTTRRSAGGLSLPTTRTVRTAAAATCSPTSPRTLRHPSLGQGTPPVTWPRPTRPAPSPPGSRRRKAPRGRRCGGPCPFGDRERVDGACAHRRAHARGARWGVGEAASQVRQQGDAEHAGAVPDQRPVRKWRGGCGHELPAAAVRRRAVMSTSAGVVQRPRERRKADSARSTSSPMARSTGEGVWWPL